ncbi:effector binding domain-containing protein [Enterococcus faecalis]|uniref:effector binding domain-containing protein n=1 Tax=Enterococcus faecalis TaxID=1351 RepID=UPI002DBFE09A|nr:effector binding domain-containing protein [Enterococcus faecalis]MEB7792169.1 GyrI-like domain-containing protein [Enterococcus faecalis]MEB7810187.1 GyrI-like domain-containing protein [Enterococcus faecalis]
MKLAVFDSKQTNNFTDPDIQSKILSLWDDYMADVKKSFKENLKVACVYHNYETDYKGDYSVSLCKEDNLNGIFDTSQYTWKEYTVDVSHENAVLNTWKKIWRDEDRNKLDRVYDFDFEQYRPDGRISIFVAIN